jgi:hypothetical protein
MASTIRRTQFSVFWAYSKRGHMEHLRKKIHETRVFDSNALHCRVREAPLSEIIALWEGALHRHWVSRHLDRAINAASSPVTGHRCAFPPISKRVNHQPTRASAIIRRH